MQNAEGYYADKLHVLADIFGTEDLFLLDGTVSVNGQIYPVIDDVIILLDPSKYPEELRQTIGTDQSPLSPEEDHFSEQIQFSFGDEWNKFSEILPEHEIEFHQYFDLIDLKFYKNSRICDLGCGNGRWSYFLRDHCRELVLVDFSQSIFIARDNLRDSQNAVFIMADVLDLPLRENFADLVICLGVLHHLPTNALKTARSLAKLAPKILIYLYYALDNRPPYFKFLLKFVTFLRKRVSHTRNSTFRSVFSRLVALFGYLPLVWLGKILRPFRLAKFVPLYEAYNNKSISRITQDSYDRFFTPIKQRFTRDEILGLDDTFSSISVRPGTL